MLTEEVLKHKSFDALSLPGLSEERKAVFVPGLAILCGVFDALAIKELRLSDGALREGVLYEMEGRFRHQDIRSRTAQSLANQYNIDREQARACWKPPPICMNSGRSRIPSSRTRSWPRC
jgi:exopolyphosphatase/guanosine-5'-triphosphate,3'-diphosphate pyrophosphatase